MIDLFINKKPSRTSRDDNKIFNFMLSARAMCLTKNRSWIEKMVGGGFISNLDGSWDEADSLPYLTQLFKVMDVFDSHYDEWDMHLQPIYPVDISGETNSGRVMTFCLVPFVIYDKITITNSREKSHDIRDLVVATELEMENGNLHASMIQGTRLSLSEKEQVSGYIHSHLNTRNIDNFNNLCNISSFCIGGTSELQDLITESASSDFDEGLIDLFLTMVDSIVKWESLEGVPYVKIQSLLDSNVKKINPGNVNISSFYTLKLKNQLLKAVRDNNILNYYISEGRYRIHDDESIAQAIKSIITDIYPSEKYYYLAKYNKGKWYGISEENIFDRDYTERNLKVDNEMPFIYFCGQKKYFKVVTEKKKEYSLDDYNVHPKLINYVIKQFEQKLYREAIRNSTVRKYNQSINA